VIKDIKESYSTNSVYATQVILMIRLMLIAKNANFLVKPANLMMFALLVKKIIREF